MLLLIIVLSNELNPLTGTCFFTVTNNSYWVQLSPADPHRKRRRIAGTHFI